MSDDKRDELARLQYLRVRVDARISELTRRRQQRDEQVALFMREWTQLGPEDREAAADVVVQLHEASVRHNPAAVAWLAERGYRRADTDVRRFCERL